MMIRINLLPVRKKVQQEAGRQILALFALVLLGAGVGNFFWYSDRNGVVEKQAAGLDSTRRRIADLESIRDSLRAAVAVGCRDLNECAGTPGCPIPFTSLASSDPRVGDSARTACIRRRTASATSLS